MSDTQFDTNIKILYVDPLVYTANITFADASQREKAVSGDFLLNAYIPKLDEEIFSDPPITAPDISNVWTSDNLSALFTQFLDKLRIHGWVVIQFYKEPPYWRVFSELDKTRWTYDEQQNVIGVDVHYGTKTQESLLFNKNQCYMAKFKEGNNKDVFSYPDLDQAMWTIATTYRQVQSQLDTMGARPEFYHVKYGNPSPAERTAVMNALDDASPIQAFAATENAVKQIDVIQHQAYDNLLKILQEKKEQFSGITRLPLAYYKGERTSGSGTGGAAENMVEIKIDRRKLHLFQIIKPIILQIFQERYMISLSTLDIQQTQIETVTIDGQTN